MASAISHPAVVLALSPWFGGRRALGKRAWALAAIATVLPDIDTAGFWFGVPYGSILGHRGLTHSLLFAAAFSAAAFLALRSRRAGVLLFLFLCAASHGILDAMTDGGRGIAFLAPFDGRRFFLPWRPIRVSPIGLGRFFGRRGLEILETELVWIWLPALALGGLGRLVKGSEGRDA